MRERGRWFTCPSIYCILQDHLLQYVWQASALENFVDLCEKKNPFYTVSIPVRSYKMSLCFSSNSNVCWPHSIVPRSQVVKKIRLHLKYHLFSERIMEDGSENLKWPAIWYLLAWKPSIISSSSTTHIDLRVTILYANQARKQGGSHLQ
jgi:hypothetical protein